MLTPAAIRRSAIGRFLSDGTGSTAIEYGLIAALVAIAILTGLGGTHDGVAAMFAYVMDSAVEALTRR